MTEHLRPKRLCKCEECRARRARYTRESYYRNYERSLALKRANNRRNYKPRPLRGNKPPISERKCQAGCGEYVTTPGICGFCERGLAK